ncbi:MAG: hypothetical protein ACNA77_09325 [Opitutales bacterium]
MLRIYLLLLLLISFSSGCEKRAEADLSAVPVDAIRQGLALMPTACNTCHGVGELEMSEMLAPPLWGVRAHYLAHFPEPLAFVDGMTDFLLEPSRAKSRMPLELAHYDLKAPVALSEAELRSVVWAIYAGRVERPVWSREYKKHHRDCQAEW